MNAARDALQAVMPERGQVDSHPGLLLQRFLRESAAGDEGKHQEKRDLLDAAIRAGKNDNTRKLYAKAFERRHHALKECHADFEAVDLASVSRLIVGLGSENVLETGIRLHHTYGLPIIPGSALKGLAAHFCDQVWGPAEEKFRRGGTYHQLLFGATDDGGCITFHDAWLTPDSQAPDSVGPLRLDVMTPHHPDYNRDPTTDLKFRAPSDFDSPTPVPFLSVCGTFRVAVSWYGPSSDKAKDWTRWALSLVRDALESWGVGGKTTSGYGRLVDPSTLDSNLAEPSSSTDRPRQVNLPNAGDRVDATLREEKTKKGGWRARHDATGITGPVQNTNDVPSDKRPGETLSLIVQSASPREIAFRYPTAADEQRAQTARGKPKSGPGGQRPRGRR